MPVYTYVCSECGYCIEEVSSIATDARPKEPCPECGAETNLFNAGI